MRSAAVYCVADANVFIGAVATINSLRLTGHDEPIYLLDCGLEEEQRLLLAQEATVLDAPEAPTPHLLKHVAPLAYPAASALLIDVDVIVTGSLRPLFEGALAGQVVAFADALSDRFDPRWSDLPGLGEIRRQPYVNSGLVALPHQLGAEILRMLATCVPAVDTSRSMVGRGNSSDPFFFLDQDVLNAILGSRVARHDLLVLDHRLAPHPPFRDVRIRDEASLSCVYPDGTTPLALHHIQRKPWLQPTRSTVYSRLLPRLLVASDLPLRLSPAELPLRLRAGTLAAMDRRRADIHARWLRLRGRVGVRRRLASLRRSDEVHPVV